MVRPLPADRRRRPRDVGPGIDPQDRDEVFEFGYSTDERGTGLGLSIIERIADAMDGTYESSKASMEAPE